MATTLYTSNASSRFDAPRLNLNEKKVRRAENLLLSAPCGVYLSSVSSYLSCSEDDALFWLQSFNAKHIDGFWVHPHYVENAKVNVLNPTVNLDTRLINSKAIQEALVDNPNVSISALMRSGNVFRVTELIDELKKIVDGCSKNTNIQILASRYLFSKFNVKYRVLNHI